MQETNISAKSPRGRLGAKLLAGAVGLTMATFGGVVATALPASALGAVVFSTNSYVIGAPSGAVTGVTVTPTSVVQAVSTGWVLKFTATSALSNSATSSITITPSTAFSLAPVAADTELIDRAGTGVCFQSGTDGGASAVGSLVVNLASGCTLNVGDTVEVDLTAEAPGSGPFTFGVTTTGNATSAASNSVTVNSVPPTLTPAVSSFGANTTWTIANIGASTASSDPWSVAGFGTAFATGAPVLQLAITNPGAGHVGSWVGSYSVTYTPPGGTAAADTVNTVTPVSATVVQLTLATAIAEGGTVNVTANVTNPAAAVAGNTNEVTITPCTSTPTCNATYAETTNAPAFGTSASAITVADNPTAAGISSQYVVGFKAGSPVAYNATDTSAGVITLTEPNTNFGTVSGVFVSDTTAGWYFSGILGAQGATTVGAGSNTGNIVNIASWATPAAGELAVASIAGLPSAGTADVVTSAGTAVIAYTSTAAGLLEGCTLVSGTGTVATGNAVAVNAGKDYASGTGNDTFTIPLARTGGDVAGTSISANDVLSVTLAGVTNPATAATVSDFAVTTTGDTVSADASPYLVTPSSTTGVTVTVNPITTAASATYLIANFRAAANLASTATIEVEAPGGTVFPNNAADFVLADSTTAAGSGTMIFGAGAYAAANDVVLTVPNGSILSGDVLSLTISNVYNPSTAGSYTIGFAGTSVEGAAVTIPAFPSAATSYPDGAIVNFAGTDYVFAGGQAFGIATPAALTGLQAVDKATVLTAATGVVVPTAKAATGTVIISTTNPTIYVVGADGELHGFATPAQFLTDGFDPADVITVTSLGGLTVGTTAGVGGVADNALSTAANGAIVDSSGTYYVFAGSKAFGIPNPAALTAVMAGDTATPLVGTVASSSTSATIQNGTVVTLAGAVYVAFGGNLYPFKAATQLTTDGYGGTPSIVVPNKGGLTVITGYSGS
jgi:hypothetical protein